MKTTAERILNTSHIVYGATSILASATAGPLPALKTRTSGSLGTSQRTESCAPPGNTATQLPVGYGMRVFSGGRGV